ncbi:Vacuolar protease A [Physocladia obscura]|uniref:Vacuolar protease A n=1 Tax=Physocladia obscura TaxID=109957 RepID=A0AAD5SX33_9FUNG|nr:Vacuolar protease A [Physocladia obscura]
MQLKVLIAVAATASSAFAAVTVPIQRGTSGIAGGRIDKIRKKIGKFTTATDSAPLVDVQDELYTTNITLSDGSLFSIDLDTGSSDTWIRGSGCSGDSSCFGSAAVYSDFSFTGLYYLVEYGSGAVAGAVFEAGVTLAGLTSNFLIGLSEIEIDMGGSDGLLGLGFSSIGVISSSISPLKGIGGNWFDALNLDNPVFAFYLSNANDGDNGEVTFGGYDSSKFTGDITWIPLENITTDYLGNPSPGYWTFDFSNWTWSVEATGGAVGGSGTVYTLPDDPTGYGATTTGIADTGTTLLYIPYTPATAIAVAISGTYDSDIGLYTIPCVNSLPPVVFQVGKASFPISSEIYTFVIGTDNNGNNICIPGISPGGDGLSIFGDTFIRAAYTIFDKGNQQLGFAQALHPSK